MAKPINAQEVNKLIARLPAQSKRLGRLEALVPQAQARFDRWQLLALAGWSLALLFSWLYWQRVKLETQFQLDQQKKRQAF